MKTMTLNATQKRTLNSSPWMSRSCSFVWICSQKQPMRSRFGLYTKPCRQQPGSSGSEQQKQQATSAQTQAAVTKRGTQHLQTPPSPAQGGRPQPTRLPRSTTQKECWTSWLHRRSNSSGIDSNSSTGCTTILPSEGRPFSAEERWRWKIMRLAPSRREGRLSTDGRSTDNRCLPSVMEWRSPLLSIDVLAPSPSTCVDMPAAGLRLAPGLDVAWPERIACSCASQGRRASTVPQPRSSAAR
mmetsp:Transcript_21268/g.61417  ORF Transcript_21268/g.61417 Transcript_21268/m.61417 type:complete len:242 (-) Transcript_21268:746-1471(-)